jgi:hypothetical protein
MSAGVFLTRAARAAAEARKGPAREGGAVPRAVPAFADVIDNGGQ